MFHSIFNIHVCIISIKIIITALPEYGTAGRQIYFVVLLLVLILLVLVITIVDLYKLFHQYYITYENYFSNGSWDIFFRGLVCTPLYTFLVFQQFCWMTVADIASL